MTYKRPHSRYGLETQLNNYKKNILSTWCIVILLCVAIVPLCGCSEEAQDEIVLRVSSWEEYIDEGDWAVEDAIELDNGTVICPDTSVLEDFTEWFYKTYNKKVRVEYSTFGTNEELYNQMLMGDEYDLVCPSEYMIMKMLDEGLIIPYSDSFYDKSKEENYYIKGVSPYIDSVFGGLSIGGKSLRDYAAGYMWGTLGIVYNPSEITEEEASHWDILLDEKYSKRITIKDSVRDAYFAGNSIFNQSIITDKNFLADSGYKVKLTDLLNSTDANTVDAVEVILSNIKDNVYSFETDSGKADMVSGKVIANQQWSGDAVYTLDQAEEDGVKLCYSAPTEATNLWFDGWVMMKNGIDGDSDKQLAAESFVNFMARPDIAIRNMCYIGYTSVISGGDDDSILEYINWNYGMDEDTAKEEGITLMEYPLGYFFTGRFNDQLSDEANKRYTITADEEQMRRQLFAQYPTEDVMKRSVVMEYFDKEENERINRMWLNVRCFDLYKFFKGN